MKNNSCLTAALLATMVVFNCNAGRGRDALRAELQDDARCLNIAVTAITSKTFTVDWDQFNFKDTDDAKRADRVSQALDKYLGDTVNKRYNLKAFHSGQSKDYDAEYRIACAEHEYYSDLRNDLAESYSKAWMAASGFEF